VTHVVRTFLLVSTALSVLALPPVMAETPAPSAQSRPPAAEVGPGSEQNPMSDIEKRRQRDLEHAANKEREQRLKRDTDKLLQLATELKLYVDKSNENVMSLEVIKKADEIEKLAKSVKEKMKGSY
jgi:hypothetical protein